MKIQNNYAIKSTHKFDKLNKKEINSGILGKIKQVLGKTLLKSTFSTSFKSQTHLHAEHMSQGKLAGNNPSIAIGKTIAILEKMNDPPKDLIHALTYARRISLAQHTSTAFLVPTVIGVGASNTITANVIKRDLKNLKTGKSLAIPCISPGHAMTLFITRQPDGKFKVVQHNQGSGIGKFHYTKIDNAGKRLYQTALEIEDVEEENLCGVGALFIDLMLANSIPTVGSTDKLYQNIFPLLKGKIAPSIDDPRVWNPGQLGGSCTASSPLSLIRAQLDEDAYQEFRDIGRTEMVLKSFKQIKKGWGNNQVQKIVTLEVVKQLEGSLEKRAVPVPEELREMKKQLEGMHKTKRVKKPPPKSLTQSLEYGFTVLKAGNFNDDSIQAAYPYINSQAPLGENELKELVDFSKRLIKYCEGRPLTENQVYMMKEISSVLIDKIGASKELTKFHNSMRRRYNAIRLSEEDLSGPPITPAGLAKLKIKMEGKKKR